MSKANILSTIMIILGIGKVIIEASTMVVTYFESLSSSKFDEPNPFDTVVEYNYSDEIEV